MRSVENRGFTRFCIVTYLVLAIPIMWLEKSSRIQHSFYRLNFRRVISRVGGMGESESTPVGSRHTLLSPRRPCAPNSAHRCLIRRVKHPVQHLQHVSRTTHQGLSMRFVLRERLTRNSALNLPVVERERLVWQARTNALPERHSYACL